MSAVHESVPDGAPENVTVTVLPVTVADVAAALVPPTVAVNADAFAALCVMGSANVKVTTSPLTDALWTIGAKVVLLKSGATVAVVDCESNAPLPLSTHTWMDD